MDAWLKSDFFARTGLSREPLRSRVLEECQSPGDFLQIVMGSIARQQDVERWADNSPLHFLFIPEIKKALPDAKFIHLIRDGRDVAMSLNRLGWSLCSPLPWDRAHGLAVSALYWEWVVRKGRKYGRSLDVSDYIEVHYEELVQGPRETLRTLSAFIGEDLDYEHIRKNCIGVVARPNSAFAPSRGGRFNPVARWKTLSGDEASRMNALLGPLLRELRYPAIEPAKLDFTGARLRSFYPSFFELKLTLRKSPFSPFLVSKDLLRSGALDDLDSRWEAIRKSASSRPSDGQVPTSSDVEHGPR